MINNKIFKILFTIILSILLLISIYVNGFHIFFMFLLLYLFFISNSIFLSRILKKNICCTIPMLFFIIIIVLYIFGLFHLLKLGLIFVIILSAIFLLYNIYTLFWKKKYKEYINLINVPGLYLFTFIFILLSITTKNVSFFVWDEYSFWSIASKNMYYLDDFYTNPNTTLWSSFYPPCPTILQYFFCKIIGIYSQGIELFTFQLFGFSLFLPFLKNINIKKSIPLFSIIFCIICLPAIFIDSTFYYTIYADSLLGIMVGYILFEYFTNQESKYMYIYLFLSMFCLSLTKSTGVVFAIIIFLIIAIYNYKIKSKNNKKICLVALLSVFLSIIPWLLNCFFSKTVYNGGYLSNSLYYDGNPIIYLLKTILKTFIGGDVQNLNITFQTFFNDFFDKSYYAAKPFALSSSAIISILALSFIIVYVYVINKSDKQKFKIFSTLTCLGAIAYILFLQLSYSLFFSTNEAIYHSSLQRYSGSIYLALTFFIVGITFYYFNVLNKKCYLYVAVSCIILLFTPIYPIANATVASGIYNYKNTKQSENVLNFARFVSNNTDKYDKILCIHQKQTNNSNILKFRYYMTPQLIIMTNPVSQDSSGMFLSINDTAAFERLIMDEFNYVVILESDEYFNSNYQQYFNSAISDWSLYSVDRKNIKLNLVR